ncbi:hypothetical protein L7F22_019465 [Adiantum nelumboides]|nr:hypothetical protein [Adiantum nelumboides]
MTRGNQRDLARAKNAKKQADASKGKRDDGLSVAQRKQRDADAMRAKQESGPFHHRAPSRIFARAVRGMVPHKTARGAAAMNRLKVYEGMPPPFDRQKKFVVPQALRVLRLKPGRKFATLKEISADAGWKYEAVVDKLEEKRKVKAVAYQERRTAANKKRAAAITAGGSGLAEINSKLAPYGL